MPADRSPSPPPVPWPLILPPDSPSLPPCDVDDLYRRSYQTAQRLRGRTAQHHRQPSAEQAHQIYNDPAHHRQLQGSPRHGPMYSPPEPNMPHHTQAPLGFPGATDPNEHARRPPVQNFGHDSSNDFRTNPRPVSPLPRPYGPGQGDSRRDFGRTEYGGYASDRTARDHYHRYNGPTASRYGDYFESSPTGYDRMPPARRAGGLWQEWLPALCDPSSERIQDHEEPWEYLLRIQSLRDSRRGW